MATQDDVRRIALSLPGAVEEDGRFAFSVSVKGKMKGFAWVWLERIHPNKALAPRPAVICVRVVDEAEKQLLLASDTEKFFTEPHYNGYPAIQVRLAAIELEELAELITDAWRCLASPELIEALDSRRDAARVRYADHMRRLRCET